ncbi:AMP-binding protein [Streptomyces sp. CJ_13]|uniref:AMP-binding protein n=1 Tax=Streptomyces sp. CJ_13 TaxID=2724943 RepID=UPI0027E399FE|nr:AMP-binding protein [Streptomyces sp. CJ_13]
MPVDGLVSSARLLADDTVTHLAGRFANVLTALGVGRQERVSTLLGRCPELYTTVLGTLRSTRVLCPLFAAFGPEPVRQRLELGDARVLVTTEALYRRKVEENRQRLPRLDRVPGADLAHLREVAGGLVGPIGGHSAPPRSSRRRRRWKRTAAPRRPRRF